MGEPTPDHPDKYERFMFMYYKEIPEFISTLPKPVGTTDPEVLERIVNKKMPIGSDGYTHFVQFYIAMLKHCYGKPEVDRIKPVKTFNLTITNIALLYPTLL